MRYKVTATVSWEVEGTSQKNAAKLAAAHLDQIVKKDQDLQDFSGQIQTELRLQKLKDKANKITHGEFSLDQVMPYITKSDQSEEEIIKVGIIPQIREYEIAGIRYPVKMNSDRYFVFKESMKCVACGLEGTRMFLESFPDAKTPHFNLYGEQDGKLILFTKDHIKAKSCGGRDVISNYQTMCQICNTLKGHLNLSLNDILIVRRLYDKNKSKLTKKSLHLLMSETKANLAKPWPAPEELIKPLSLDAVSISCDLHLFRLNCSLYGHPIYKNTNKDVIGCIRKGTMLEPLVVVKNEVMCKIWGNEVVILSKDLIETK